MLKRNMRLKIKISKKGLLRLLLFMVLTGTSVFFDHYFENHPESFKERKTEGNDNKSEQGFIYLISQVNNTGAKLSNQKLPERKLLDQAHDRLLQKCHQLRNHLAFKSERKAPLKPLFLSYHHLIFRNHFAPPDNEPPIS